MMIRGGQSMRLLVVRHGQSEADILKSLKKKILVDSILKPWSLKKFRFSSKIMPVILQPLACSNLSTKYW